MYMALDQFLFLLTVTLCGVGGALCTMYYGICRLSIASLIMCICCGVPMLCCWWYIHRIWIVSSSVISLYISWGALGSSYVIVSIAK